MHDWQPTSVEHALHAIIGNLHGDLLQMLQLKASSNDAINDKLNLWRKANLRNLDSSFLTSVTSVTKFSIVSSTCDSKTSDISDLLRLVFLAPAFEEPRNESALFRLSNCADGTA